MIEILLNTEFRQDADNDLMWMSNLIGWLVTTIAMTQDKKPEDEKLKLRGYVVLVEEGNRVAGLLLCDGKDQDEILKIIKQPPDNFKGKYEAHILVAEPMPVMVGKPKITISTVDKQAEEPETSSDAEEDESEPS